jgi:hypothetical protein
LGETTSPNGHSPLDAGALARDRALKDAEDLLDTLADLDRGRLRRVLVTAGFEDEDGRPSAWVRSLSVDRLRELASLARSELGLSATAEGGS